MGRPGKTWWEDVGALILGASGLMSFGHRKDVNCQGIGGENVPLDAPDGKNEGILAKNERVIHYNWEAALLSPLLEKGLS